MNEIVPVFFGVMAGVILGAVTVRRRPLVGALVSVLLGLAATFVTGEWRLSWAFILIDVPIVALAAAIAYTVARRFTSRRLAPRSSP